MVHSDKSSQYEEVKTQFRAREGYYRLMSSPDYVHNAQRALLVYDASSDLGTATGSASDQAEKTTTRLSFVTTDERNDPIVGVRHHQSSNSSLTGNQHRSGRANRDRKMCLNIGRELYIFNYDGIKTGPDTCSPLYKRAYKGVLPTCHDFNRATATPDRLSLLVGLSQGQVQLIDLCDTQSQPVQNNFREFNSDRSIDKSRVTCIKWLPNSPSLFLASHASGQLYLYKDDLNCGLGAPVYQLYKQSDEVVLCTCKSKTTRNPIYRWSIGARAVDATRSSLGGSSASLHPIENESCAINEFVFSPCTKYLACASQDGFLRVFCYDSSELIGRARSYYGGLSCVCWSPDGKYVLTGGEDDLITIWSFLDRCVVARAIGHKSWVSVVSFDLFCNGYDLKDNDIDNDDEEDEDGLDVEAMNVEPDEDDDDEDEITVQPRDARLRSPKSLRPMKNDDTYDEMDLEDNLATGQTSSYRFGSVGQDTLLCLWDLNDDLLKQTVKPKLAKSTVNGTSQNDIQTTAPQVSLTSQMSELKNKLQAINISEKKPTPNVSNGNSDKVLKSNDTSTTSSSSSLSLSKESKFSKTFSLSWRRGKRKRDKSGSNLDFNSVKHTEDPTKLLGSPICPRMNEVPLLQPSISKKISHERLTSLTFCRGGFITSCQDGFLYSWARPKKRFSRRSATCCGPD